MLKGEEKKKKKKKKTKRHMDPGDSDSRVPY
jgi:hypothetical protein